MEVREVLPLEALLPLLSPFPVSSFLWSLSSLGLTQHACALKPYAVTQDTKVHPHVKNTRACSFLPLCLPEALVLLGDVAAATSSYLSAESIKRKALGRHCG